MRRDVVLVLAAAVAAMTYATSLAAQTVLRLGNDVGSTTIQAKANERFAEEVAKRNVGIEVKVFHNNQLGNGVQQIQNVKLGVQDMVNTGYELLEPFSNDLRIAGTPFTFVDRDHFEAWLRSPHFEKVQQEIIEERQSAHHQLGRDLAPRPLPRDDRRPTDPQSRRLLQDQVSGTGVRPAEALLGQGGHGLDAGRSAAIGRLSVAAPRRRECDLDAARSGRADEIRRGRKVRPEHLRLSAVCRRHDQRAEMAVVSAEQRKAITDAVDEAGKFYNQRLPPTSRPGKSRSSKSGRR